MTFWVDSKFLICTLFIQIFIGKCVGQTHYAKIHYELDSETNGSHCIILAQDNLDKEFKYDKYSIGKKAMYKHTQIPELMRFNFYTVSSRKTNISCKIWE